MKVRQLEIENFRGIVRGKVVFRPHTLLVGGNNIGKSTVCEALELVLGPERTYRRPVIDEHDFTNGEYLSDDGEPREIKISAVLTDLTSEQQRRFCQHLRHWDDASLSFVDDIRSADIDGVSWALPVIFIGRYDREEDDFIGDTFFDHPQRQHNELDEDEKASLGLGRSQFSRAHKRFCGFVFLRALRTGSRALSLQRGSLLDTILRLEGQGAAEMWQNALHAMRDLDPAIGDIDQLKIVRQNIRSRLSKFVNLAPNESSVAFFASDLTREHLREVVRLFVATQPSDHSVPFVRQGTGSVNLLVFALLTIIADLKKNHSIIFVMEEPEIALPPHIQRRVTKYVLQQMGQSVVTSHSPYVIEQFDPENVVILSRSQDHLSGEPINTLKVKPKTYRTQRRQFAEAILSRAVFVLEGQTEIVTVHAVSSALERFRNDYSHIDLAGVTLFNAGGDREVPRYGPIFKTLGKQVYGLRDKLNSPDANDAADNIKCFDEFWESEEDGIEQVLVKQVPTQVLRKFLNEAVERDDYPSNCHYEADKVADSELPQLVAEVLKARKGDAFGFGYASMLIEQCQTEEDLPAFIRDALLAINERLGREPIQILADTTAHAIGALGSKG